MKIVLFMIFLGYCVISAQALPRRTVVKDSSISNINTRANIRAAGKSDVNTGIQARNAVIKNSKLSNRFEGNVDASNNSDVSTGIRIHQGTVKNSEIKTDTKANITARNGTVRTGVDLNNASNAKISTKVRGNVTAIGATAKVGSIEGSVSNKKINTNVEVDDVQARGRNVNIGSVQVQHSFQPVKGTKRNKRNENGGAGVGNVYVNSNLVRKVDVDVGSGSMSKSVKARHMSKVYAKEGGVDPSGTKHVYVKRRDRKRAEKGMANTGNTYIDRRNRKIRKVNTVVE
jgi:hypothetical protein